MKTISHSVKFFLALGKTQSIITHRLDRGLGGLSFNEFLILNYLEQEESKKMRRVDLAEKIGMTASGVTRLLLPMEKVHVIKSGPVEQDARVRFVTITTAGKEKLDHALERLDYLAGEVLSDLKDKEIEALSKTLIDIGGKAMMS